MKSGIECIRGKADKLHIKFDNGLTASIVWSACTYSDHYDDNPWDFATNREVIFESSSTVEVAVIGKDGNLIDGVEKYLPSEYNTPSDNQTLGYLSMNDLAEFLYNVSKEEDPK